MPIFFSAQSFDNLQHALGIWRNGGITFYYYDKIYEIEGAVRSSCGRSCNGGVNKLIGRSVDR